MWNQISNSENENFRNSWIIKKLKSLRTVEEQSLLDVGSGLQPYKTIAVNLGYRYTSHDFSMYDPKLNETKGLQNMAWDYPSADVNCDLLMIPEKIKYDVILCTEVLEHVPDPVASFNKLVTLLSPNGVMIISVPLLSLMHQSPYWFSSGLSPQWFEYQSKCNLINIEDLTIYGDYVDFLEQEIFRVFPLLNHFHTFSLIRSFIKKIIRKNLNTALLESAGFGVVYIGRSQSLRQLK